MYTEKILGSENNMNPRQGNPAEASDLGDPGLWTSSNKEEAGSDAGSHLQVFPGGIDSGANIKIPED